MDWLLALCVPFSPFKTSSLFTVVNLSFSTSFYTVYYCNKYILHYTFVVKNCLQWIVTFQSLIFNLQQLWAKKLSQQLLENDTTNPFLTTFFDLQDHKQTYRINLDLGVLRIHIKMLNPFPIPSGTSYCLGVNLHNRCRNPTDRNKFSFIVWFWVKYHHQYS